MCYMLSLIHICLVNKHDEVGVTETANSNKIRNVTEW